MTAEIAIMNKEAVALASDSAVTATTATSQKIFTSANKLFSLSKYQPVGIMVYGSAIFMDVPWETIIKIYRNQLNKKKFDTLEKYAGDFVAFLDNGNTLFPKEVQDRHFKNSVHAYFMLLRKQIEDKVHERLDKEREIPKIEIEKIISTIIKNHCENWEKVAHIPSVPSNFSKDLIRKHKNTIAESIKEVFEKLPLNEENSNRLFEIAGSLFSKFPEGIQKTDMSGIVIAGFGEKDTFPSLNSFDVEGIVDDKLKYREYISRKIDFETSATIIPFAQREMVHTFMEGINPELETQMTGYLSEIFNKYPELIVENIEKFSGEEKETLKNKLKTVSEKILKDYKGHLESLKRENYIDPVLGVVGMLPKDELAAMAESLVNLTSFKRKVTMESETVGGPIDVAVISKGDGLIWIKRKHYFKVELNPQFTANYYKV